MARAKAGPSASEARGDPTGSSTWWIPRGSTVLLPAPRRGETVGLDRALVGRRSPPPRVLIDVMGFLEDEDPAGSPRAGCSSTSTRASRSCGASWATPTRSRRPRSLRDRGAATSARPDARSRPAARMDRSAPPSASSAGPLADEPADAPFAASAAGGDRTTRSSTRAGRWACACTSFATSSSCRSESRRAFEVALDIDPARSRRHRAAGANGWRLVDPGAVAGSLAGYRGSSQASRRRDRDREEHLRRDRQRLVQRSQRLLPGQRQTGTGAGHRFRRRASRSAKVCSRSRSLDEAVDGAESDPR